MTVLDWLQSRTPIPPAAMTARIVTALGSRAGEDVAGATALCLDAATELLERLLQHDEIGRDAAIDLLAADALVTYAFESAASDIELLDDRAVDAMTRLGALSAAQGRTPAR
jgi:hypothetical protein